MQVSYVIYKMVEPAGVPAPTTTLVRMKAFKTRQEAELYIPQLGKGVFTIQECYIP